MTSGLMDKATERWKKLGYSSFSEYVQFLLEADVSDRPPHLTLRNEDQGTKHQKTLTYDGEVEKSPRVAEDED